MMRVATRGSALALAQACAVADRLSAGGTRVEVVTMRTEGDRLAEARLAAIGGKGLFVREIEEALLRGDADVAVHSLKDLPAELPRGLRLAAFPERADARDVLVARRPLRFAELPAGAVLGTSSPRRRALALTRRADPVRLDRGLYLANVLGLLDVEDAGTQQAQQRVADAGAHDEAIGTCSKCCASRSKKVGWPSRGWPVLLSSLPASCWSAR